MLKLDATFLQPDLVDLGVQLFGKVCADRADVFARVPDAAGVHASDALIDECRLLVGQVEVPDVAGELVRKTQDPNVASVASAKRAAHVHVQPSKCFLNLMM